MTSFGTTFTDHLVTMTWTPETGWQAPSLRPYGPLELDPATSVLHYGQEIFEGLKAYRHPDGSIWTFRPVANAERMQRSARRMALPELPVDDFVAALDLLVDADRDQVPSGGETSLYLRPFMFASEVFLGVRPAHHVTFCVIASPVGSYFSNSSRPITVWLERTYARAGVGGTGTAKCGGNYAASLLPQREAIGRGCDQVVFTALHENGRDHVVQEMGSANLFFVTSDRRLVTPELEGTILDGITRDSLLTLAGDLGLVTEERPVTVEEWCEGVTSGRIIEVFASGAAAVVTPIGRLRWHDGEIAWGGDTPGPIVSALRDSLLDVQFGRAPDRHRWLHPVCPVRTDTL